MSVDINRIAKSDESSGIQHRDKEIERDLKILEELEREELPTHIRQARIDEMRMKARETQLLHENKNENYPELSEDEFLKTTTTNKKCMIHFFHPDFKRCDIMHSHLRAMALKYPEVKIAKINVERAKFFVNKLNIQVLPAVLCFIDGVLKQKIIGFEAFKNSDTFATREIEKRLWKQRFLTRPAGEDLDSGSENEENEGPNKKTSIFRRSAKNDSGSDSDY